MNVYYLKFPTENDAINILSMYRRANMWILATREYSLNVVGHIYTKGTYDNTGMELIAPILLDGFHINMLTKSELSLDLQPFQIFPSTPSNQFFL